MTEFLSLYRFTPNGMSFFKDIFEERMPEDALDVTGAEYAEPVPGTESFCVKNFSSRKEMAAAIIASLGEDRIEQEIGDAGIWAWLTYVMRNNLFKQKSGKRLSGEVHTWLPSDPNDYQKAQRHKVRMPVLLLSRFGDDADHLLCGHPNTPGELAEQLTSQQAMFTSNFQSIAKSLYYDPETGKNRRGAASKNIGGTSRRLAKVRWQFNQTWELEYFNNKKFLEMLPKEFDRFKLAEVE